MWWLKMRKQNGGREGLLSIRELGARLNMSGSTVRRWVSAQILPPPRRFPDGNYWLPEEVDTWMKNHDRTTAQVAREMKARIA